MKANKELFTRKQLEQNGKSLVQNIVDFKASMINTYNCWNNGFVSYEIVQDECFPYMAHCLDSLDALTDTTELEQLYIKSAHTAFQVIKDEFKLQLKLFNHFNNGGAVY